MGERKSALFHRENRGSALLPVVARKVSPFFTLSRALLSSVAPKTIGTGAEANEKKTAHFAESTTLQRSAIAC
jgi:hypothetical protein